MVKLYTTTTCPRCQALKGIFNENHVSYEEVNIEQDFVARAKLIEHDIFQVPALEVAGTVKSGEVAELAEFATKEGVNA